MRMMTLRNLVKRRVIESKKIELLKETTIFTLWKMEYKKESRELLVTVEGNIAEEVLEELKAKAVIQEELDSMLN